MANSVTPFGLSPYANADGSPWNQQVRRYYIPSTDNTAYYIGDVVKSLAGADANGVPGVVAAAGTDTLRGVIVGVEVAAPEAVSLQGVDLSLSRANIPATKTRDYYVYVCDDPSTIFEVQGDSTGTNQTAANSNKNASLTIAAPSNTALPYSATVINSGSINTTQGLNIKLMGLSPRRPAGAFGANATWLCKINQHELMGNTAGI
jgi:hypothetical protein